MQTDADDVRAVVNRGATGVAQCSRDMTVELPAFDLTCQMAPDDSQAYISVVASKGRMLEGPVAHALARRPEARSYRRPIVRLPRRNDPVTALIDGINALRRQADLGALRPEPAEARLMSSLYPTAFRAELEYDFESLYRFEDEVHAGRAVVGAIRWSSVMHEIACAGNASDWLAKMLTLPASRQMLFHPRSSRLLQSSPPPLATSATITLRRTKP